jgi:hypothetical protein
LLSDYNKTRPKKDTQWSYISLCNYVFYDDHMYHIMHVFPISPYCMYAIAVYVHIITHNASHPPFIHAVVMARWWGGEGAGEGGGGEGGRGRGWGRRGAGEGGRGERSWRRWKGEGWDGRRIPGVSDEGFGSFEF